MTDIERRLVWLFLDGEYETVTTETVNYLGDTTEFTVKVIVA